MIETGNGGDILYSSKTMNIKNYLAKSFAEQNVNRKTDVFYFVLYAVVAVFGVILWLLKAIELNKLIIIFKIAKDF